MRHMKQYNVQPQIPTPYPPLVYTYSDPVESTVTI